MKRHLYVVVMMALGSGAFVIQPAFGKCVTNHIKETVFSNCGAQGSVSTQPMEGVTFTKFDDDTSGSRAVDGAPPRKLGAKNASVIQDEKIKFELFKEDEPRPVKFEHRIEKSK